MAFKLSVYQWLPQSEFPYAGLKYLSSVSNLELLMLKVEMILKGKSGNLCESCSVFSVFF